MSDHADQTTIFYKLKLKRTRTPLEVIEKMRKTIKKKGATKDWICTVDEEAQTMCVDFGEDKGESFFLSFDENKVCDGFCKVFFPLSGEEFDDEKKSEFKALLNMIYAARTSFAEMNITDDYGISESYLDTKVNKIALRELSEEELERAKRLFADGHTSVREFITALMYDLRDMTYDENFVLHINMNAGWFAYSEWEKLSDVFETFTESFLYETTEYKNEGRLYDTDGYHMELCGTFFSVHAFVFGISEITGYFQHKTGWDPKSTQVLRLYYNKCLPILENTDNDFEKCVIAYRFFMSSLEYLGFKYVGKGTKYNFAVPDVLVKEARKFIEDGDMKKLRHSFCEWNWERQRAKMNRLADKIKGE